MLHLGRRDTDRQCRAESAPEVLRTAMPVRDGEDHTCALACWRCPGYGTLRGQAVRAVGSPVDRLASHTPLRRHVFMDHSGILSASGLCQRHTARVALRTLCERSWSANQQEPG